VVRVQIELVAEQHHERLGDACPLGHEEGRPEPAVDVVVHVVADLETERRAVAVRRADLVAEVADDEVHVPDTELVAQQLDVSGEERLAGDLQEDLRHGDAAGMDACAAPGGADDGRAERRTERRGGHGPVCMGHPRPAVKACASIVRRLVGDVYSSSSGSIRCAELGVFSLGLTTPRPRGDPPSVRILFYYRGIENLGVGYLMSAVARMDTRST
jgi:hypothetical protein